MEIGYAETQKRYLNLLRNWFKNNHFTPKVMAAVYMTGILPIKKDGSQSAISDFQEYSILAPEKFAKYTGFVEEEVHAIAGKAGEVAKAIDAVRKMQYAPTFYNDEQALRYVIKFAYIVAIDQYLKVEELPSGKGIADVVYLPKRRSLLPALAIELKWNKTARGALE